MNNKLLLIAGAAIASVGISSSAIAVQATGNATANVVVPMTIVPTPAAPALSFGDIVGGTGGTVIITPAGALDGASTLTSTGALSAGSFDITGSGNKTFSIAIAKVTDLVNGTDDLVISAFTNSEGGATGTLSSGALTLTVGATITLDGSEPANTYTGTYTVDVDYN